MANIVMAKHYNMSRVVGQRKTELNRRKKKRRAMIERRNQTVLLEQLKTKEDEPLKTIACIR